ncbi:MAG: helix-turn-helix domain-containing protein [bacterium]
MAKVMMDVKEVAEYLGFSPVKIYRMARARKIPVLRIERQWRFRKENIDRWLEEKSTLTEGNNFKKRFDLLRERTRRKAEDVGFTLSDVQRLIDEVRRESA